MTINCELRCRGLRNLGFAPLFLQDNFGTPKVDSGPEFRPKFMNPIDIAGGGTPAGEPPVFKIFGNNKYGFIDAGILGTMYLQLQQMKENLSCNSATGCC